MAGSLVRGQREPAVAVRLQMCLRDRRRLVGYGIPSIAQQSFVSVGNVIIQYYVNLCGATVIAGFSAATKVNMFALTCCMSFSSGLSSYVAQNIGARRLDPVSYTHLDVYKRQSPCCPAGCPRGAHPDRADTPDG